MMMLASCSTRAMEMSQKEEELLFRTAMDEHGDTVYVDLWEAEQGDGVDKETGMEVSAMHEDEWHHHELGGDNLSLIHI